MGIMYFTLGLWGKKYDGKSLIYMSIHMACMCVSSGFIHPLILQWCKYFLGVLHHY